MNEQVNPESNDQLSLNKPRPVDAMPPGSTTDYSNSTQYAITIPVENKKRGLGWTAFILSLVAFGLGLVSITASAFIGTIVDADTPPEPNNLISAVLFAVWLSSAVVVCPAAFILGIIAVVKKAKKNYGVAAIVISCLAPFASLFGSFFAILITSTIHG